MREFIVEVPATIRVIVDALDAGAAARVAGSIVERLSFGESLERVGGSWQLVQPEVLPVDEEDAQPDVYVCAGGGLAFIEADGGQLPLDEPCP